MHARYAVTLVSALAVAVVFSNARAGNVDLATVPSRDSVQLTVYNSADLTLVRETRRVSFKAGLNVLQFGWANTLIDPTSVELRFPGQSDALEVLDTAFPHDRPQMLYWNVASELDGEATVEISYFTSGIAWTSDYLAVADHEERKLRLEGFIRVRNGSGEEYPDAQVRVVVGTINLVEQIAQLARVRMDQVGKMEAGLRTEFRQRAARKMLMNKDAVVAQEGLAGSVPAAEPKTVYKEGLSEYFIYTIEGTETIANGWSKRLRSFEARDVPFEVRYRYRPLQYGERLVRFYLLRNDEASGLGTTPLPGGLASIYRDNARDGLSFLARDTLKYVPVGDRIELDLGQDPRVRFELARLRSFRDNIWLKMSKGNVYRRPGSAQLRVDHKAKVAGWDEHTIYAQRVRNFGDRPIRIEVRRHFDGDAVFRSALDPKRHDFRTVEFEATVEAGETRDLLFELVERKGRNREQQRLELAEARIARPVY